ASCPRAASSMSVVWGQNRRLSWRQRSSTVTTSASVPRTIPIFKRPSPQPMNSSRKRPTWLTTFAARSPRLRKPEASWALGIHRRGQSVLSLLELDELWSFVLKKARDSWIWIALCRNTRQVVAYAVGDQSKKTCQRLWEAIPAAYRQGHCFTDFWAAYKAVIPKRRFLWNGSQLSWIHRHGSPPYAGSL